MSLHRGIEGPEPARGEPAPVAGAYEHRRAVGLGRLGVGTLACPECDAPVFPNGRLAPADPIGCPFCGHGSRVRDFLSLAAPSRPARVAVIVAMPV